jgi:hypothetical protein
MPIRQTSQVSRANKIQKTKLILCTPHTLISTKITINSNRRQLSKQSLNEAGIAKKKSRKPPKSKNEKKKPKLATSRTATALGTPLPRACDQSCAATAAANNAETESGSVLDIDAEQ